MAATNLLGLSLVDSPVAGATTGHSLDGSLAANKRQERVDAFNHDLTIFAFLLSSKAGGCGINLIGANR